MTVVGAVVNGETVLTVIPLTLTFTPDRRRWRPLGRVPGSEGDCCPRR